MPSKSTNYGITLTGLVDLSQARKDIESFTNNKGENRARKIVLDTDIKLDDISKKLDNAINKNLIKKVDDSMKRVSTKIKDEFKTIYDANGDVASIEKLNKVTETFQNNLGKIQERVTILDSSMKPVTSSIQTLKEGIQSITTETETSIGKVGNFDAKITQVTESITDTSGKTTEVIKKTTEWVDASGKLNQQLEITDKKGKQLSATQTKICDDTKKATKLTNELATAMGKVQAPKNEKTSTITYVSKDGVKTIVQMNNGMKTLTTTVKEYTNAQGALIKETKELNHVTGDTKVHTEVIKNKQQEAEESRKLQEKLRQERLERKKLQEQIDKGLISTTTNTSKGKVSQFGANDGRQYDALVTTIRKVDSEGKKTIQTIYEFTNVQGQLVRQMRTTDQYGRKVAQDEIEISRAAESASKATNDLSDATRKAANEQKTLGSALGDAMARLVRYYVASLPIRALQTAISEAITTVKEFDSALIEFRKVSDLAGESLTRYVAKLAEMGEVTGSTMQAMVEAATEFRKSGFTDEDSAKLASIAEKYRNIADEEISAGESASFIIAQMKAFNIEADQAEHIIDSVNEVANNFSVSSADLATNLGNMSAIMAINNVSLEEQIGMLTGVTEITRNASSASRGLVMVSSRLTQVLDDTSSTGKKLTAIYAKLGIEIKDENGQLRSHYDILGDLAGQWDKLSENEQKYIALTSAGARQQQNFVALMENWNQVAKATVTAYNSMGSAQKENAKVMDSIEKKTQILRSEFQKLVIGDGGLQGVVKKVLDLGIALLKLANTPIGKITSEIALLTAGVYGLVTAIHSLTVAMATNPLLLLITALAAVVVVAIEVADAEDAMTRAHRENIEAVKEAQEEYESLTNEIDRLKQAIKDIEDKKVNITDSEDLAILEAEEESLRRQVDLLETKAEIERKKAEKTAKEELGLTYDFYNTQTGQMSQLHRVALSDDEETDAIHEQITLLKQLNAEQNNLNAETQEYRKRLALLDVGSEAYQNLDEKIQANEKDSADLQRQIEETESGFHDFLQETEQLGESLTSADDETQKLRKELFKGVGEGLKYFKENSLGVIKEELKEFSKGGNVDLTLRPRIDTEELKKAGYDAGEGVATVFTHTFTNEANDIAMNFTPIMVDPNTGEYLGVMKKDEFEKYCEDVVNGVREDDLNLKIGVDFKKEDTEDFIQEAENAAQKIHELHEEEDNLTESIEAYNSEADDTEEVTEDIEGAIDELAKSLGLTATEFENLNEQLDTEQLYDFLTILQESRQTIEDTSSTIDGLQDALEKASNALEEYNENGYLTLDTFQDLMSVKAEYLTALVNENGQLEINQTTLSDLVDTLKIAKIEELGAAAAAEINALRNQEAESASYGAEAAADAAGEAFKRAGDKASKAAAGIDVFTASMQRAGFDGKTRSNQEREILNRYKGIVEEISNWSVNVTRAGNASSKAGKKAAGAAKEAKDATKELNKELEETKKKYETVIKWISKQYDKEIDKIKKAEKEALKAEEAKIKAKEKEKDNALDAIEKEINALEKEKDARKKYWDDQIDALKKQNDAAKDALELQEKLDALEKARNTRVKIYKEGQGFVYDVDQTAVAEAQKELDEYLSQKAYEDELERLEALRDAEMDNYEQRLDALNDYKDKVQEVYEAEIEALNEHKEKLQEQYEAEIEIYENYKQQFEDMVNAYEEEQNRLLAQQLTHIDFENKNWMTRLDNLAAFVNEYNKLQKQLDTGNTSVSNSANLKSGGGLPSSSSNTKNSNKSSTAQYDSRGFKLNEGYTSNNGQVSKTNVAYVPTDVAKQLGGSSGRIYTHANGISSIKDDEIAVVGENPNKEIVIGSKINNGELMNLGKGTGVVNADSSKALAGMLNQVSQFGASGFGSGNGTLNNNINNDSLVINGVTVQGSNIKDPETFVNGLLNLKAEALQRAYKHR